MTRTGDYYEPRWDSGKHAATAAVNIACGSDLQTGASYTWSAQFWESGSRASNTSSAAFDVGLADADWAGALWLGGGDKQFKLPVSSAVMAIAASTGTKVKLRIASPGGATVEMGSEAVGDAVGVSLWADNQRSVHYFSFDLTAVLLNHGGGTDIVVDCGSGFWASNTSDETWGHGQDRDMQPGHAACKLLLEADNGGGSRQVLVRSGHVAGGILGRTGPILSDDPWRGATVDLTLSASAGWASAKLALDTPLFTPRGTLFPLPAPYAAYSGSAQAVTVAAVPQRPGTFLYTFPRQLVGHASVKAGAVTGSGTLRLEYCEVWDHALGGCVPFLPPFTLPIGSHTAERRRPICNETIGAWNAGCDHFLLGAVGSHTRAELNPKFTWHAFQFVLVSAGAGVRFSGAVDALTARWSGAAVKETATIHFGGEGSALLGGIRDITKSSQRANVAAYMPTDCPSREKHGWTGDSQVTAEEAMYNLWLPGTFQTFLRNLNDSQITDDSPWHGYIAPNVPVLQGTCGNLAPDGGFDGHCVLPTSDGHDTNGHDVSYTAAYPLIVGWLLQYYGDMATARRYWPSLKSFCEGQIRMAENVTADGLVDFWTYGDWKSIENHAEARLSAASQLAAANWLLALQAMAKVAAVLGETSDAQRYQEVYASSVRKFDQRWWNATTHSWTDDRDSLQSVTAIALGAGVGKAERRAAAIEALDRDVIARQYHLTYGEVGAKWVLRMLSEVGKHLGSKLQWAGCLVNVETYHRHTRHTHTHTHTHARARAPSHAPHHHPHCVSPETCPHFKLS